MPNRTPREPTHRAPRLTSTERRKNSTRNITKGLVSAVAVAILAVGMSAGAETDGASKVATEQVKPVAYRMSTFSQQQAIGSAKSYLRMQGFSKVRACDPSSPLCPAEMPSSGHRRRAHKCRNIGAFSGIRSTDRVVKENNRDPHSQEVARP